MSYIKVSDIKAKVAEGFQLQDYILEADAAINDLAEMVGVRDTSDIETNPLHFKLKRYGVVYILMRLCQDKVGSNDVSVDLTEKYFVQYGMYQKELGMIRNEISREMVTGEVNQISDRAFQTGIIF